MLREHLWARYLPGLVASLSATCFICGASSTRKIPVTLLTTLVGLLCMESEYWIAHGFPYSEVPFFCGAVAVTLAALVTGRLGGLLLGVVGLAFFSYVNLRYGAPYLLDYVMPALYAILTSYSRREMKWVRPGVFRTGLLEGLWFILLQGLVVWRTTRLLKWGWLTGDPW